ncbi:MAG: glucosamine-6-phosphate deaminase, partial [Rectinemataceae bacterium]|nr:glucosamine-6-phosphate deaminase [Rectinemataceae bacterium]
MKTVKEMMAGTLKVKIYKDRKDMGSAAAAEMSAVLKNLLKAKDEVNIIFAAAPSQNEFLGALIRTDGIDWNRVNAFHMDEYIGLDGNAVQGFGNFLKDRIFGKVPFKTVHYIDGNANDPEEESLRYADLLKRHPVDIVCMGIGENGHIAFNDPHVARFDDDLSVKVVKLDERSRIQQVNDGCFSRLDDVPMHALTLTIPALISAKYLFCVVPDGTKAKAVGRTITGNIDESCPASILKTHDRAVLYI